MLWSTYNHEMQAVLCTGNADSGQIFNSKANYLASKPAEVCFLLYIKKKNFLPQLRVTEACLI